MTPTTSVRPQLAVGAAVGAVSRRIFGQFSEHLHDVIQGGLYAELLVDRKFGLPGVHGRIRGVADGWERVGPEGVQCRRGDTPYAMDPGPDCHHAQIVDFAAGRAAGAGGIRQVGIPLDAGTRYLARLRCNVVGPVGDLAVALHDADGGVIARALVPVPGDAAFAGHDLGGRLTPAAELEARLDCPATVEHGAFSITAEPSPEAAASLWIHSASLMPEGSADGLHAATAHALRELPAVVVKWPGGCFADNYDWRLGIGPRDTRHGAPDYAWGTWEENDFGTDEFLRWCERTATEPYICVNHGTGSPELAAAWVEYCNGPVTSEWGAQRAANGHPEPYGVKLWAIGNEVFGFWERGSAKPDAYAAAVHRFAAAMRAVDPTIQVAAQGDTGAYTEALLPLVGPIIDLLSVHHYSGRLEPFDIGTYLAQARDFETVLGRVVAAIRSTPGAGHVRIALDEWGWTPTPMGPVSAVFCACVLNAVSRLAPHVELGGHCCVANPMGVLTRRGERLERSPMYDLFHLYATLHRGTAHRVDGVPAEVDAIAYTDDSGTSLIVANTTDADVTVELPFTDAGEVRLHRVGAQTQWDVPWHGSTVTIAGFQVVGVSVAAR